MFFICHAARVVTSFQMFEVSEKMDKCERMGFKKKFPPWLEALSPINHFMLIVNSSVNFLIYCAVGSRYVKNEEDAVTSIG